MASACGERAGRSARRCARADCSRESELAELTGPGAVADVEHRAAAIAELTKRAGLAVPIQNEATFYRAEALERLAVLVDEQEVSSLDTAFRKGGKLQPRVSEGRSLARTGALAEARAKAQAKPDVPVSMSDILKQAKRRERESALREQTQTREREARDAIREAPERPYQMVVSDIAAWRPEGVASIITDPPYIGDSIPLYEKLRDFAVDVLPEGAPLVVMTWQAILPAVIRALDHPSLAYRWTICWRYANTEHTADHARRVFDCWKPILVYHAGAMPKDAPMVRDEIANAAPDKDFHEWGQAVSGFERLVRSFSQPGDVVCDPFLGGGTTAVAALALTRRFVGCDIDAVAVSSTRARLEARA